MRSEPTGYAAAARNAATEAEKDAAGARAAANAATADADNAATVASAAERAAVAAEAAAANAQKSATEADQAATRAEAALRERIKAQRTVRVDAGSPATEPDLTSDEEAILLKTCGQTCVDQWRAAKAATAQDVLDWVKANGGEILLDTVGYTDAKKCFSEGDVEGCLWTLVNAISIATIALKLPAISMAIARVAMGITKFFEASAKGKRVLKELRAEPPFPDSRSGGRVLLLAPGRAPASSSGPAPARPRPGSGLLAPGLLQAPFPEAALAGPHRPVQALSAPTEPQLPLYLPTSPGGFAGHGGRLSSDPVLAQGAHDHDEGRLLPDVMRRVRRKGPAQVRCYWEGLSLLRGLRRHRVLGAGAPVACRHRRTG